MRGLPQTAWMIHDERKLETSVHELIADRVQKLTKATGKPHDQNAMYLKIYFPGLRSERMVRLRKMARLIGTPRT